VFCKREFRIQKTGVRRIEHVARERVTILNTEFWLLASEYGACKTDEGGFASASEIRTLT
jgi:hypothetical protein